MPIIKEINRNQIVSLFDECNLYLLGFYRQSATLVYLYTIMCENNIYEYNIEDNYSVFDVYKRYDNYQDCYDVMMNSLNNIETIDAKMERTSFLNDIIETNERQKEYWKTLEIEEPYPNIKFKIVNK